MVLVRAVLVRAEGTSWAALAGLTRPAPYMLRLRNNAFEYLYQHFWPPSHSINLETCLREQ